jgi:hypothetical protein
LFRIKQLKFLVVVILAAVMLAACGSKASVVANNISTEADNFQIARVITFYNGFTGQDILEVKGLCSIGEDDPNGGSSQDAPVNGQSLTVTCEVSKGKFIKDFLGLSNNVTYVAQQISGASVSDTHYQVIWRPSTLIPGISVQ